MYPEKQDRNQKIYDDWRAGMSGVRLVAKYKISSSAIYAIVKRIQNKRRFKKSS